MFLRAHGRKSMPVCLEALLFLCSFVLMFSALAANLIEHHILLTSSLSVVCVGQSVSLPMRFLRLGCFSVFSLWFRTISDSVYQFVNATFHNGIGIAQHSVKYSFHDHTIWFSIKVKCRKGNTETLYPTKKVYNLYTNICSLPVYLHVKECVCFYCHLTLFMRNRLIHRYFKSVR